METPMNENEKDSGHFVESEPNVQDKPDDKLVTTVTPANENGVAGPPDEKENEAEATE